MNRLAFVLSFLLVLPVSLAFAETSVTATVSGDVSAGQDLHVQDTVEASSSGALQGESARQGKGSDELSASSSERAAAKEESHESVTETSNEQASTTDQKGSDMSEEHRSVVASVVQSLLAVSVEDGGIGAQVREVAQSQQESASTTAEAIAKVQGRSKFLTILFGTDWKNIGVLRSEIAQTDTDAARLQTAISQTTDPTVKATLAAQLSLINAEQAKVSAFVDAQEKTFSLFGWFTKLFAGTSVSASATTTAQ